MKSNPNITPDNIKPMVPTGGVVAPTGPQVNNAAMPKVAPTADARKPISNKVASGFSNIPVKHAPGSRGFK